MLIPVPPRLAHTHIHTRTHITHTRHPAALERRIAELEAEAARTKAGGNGMGVGDKAGAVIAQTLFEKNEAAAASAALRAVKLAELLPGGEPPACVALWTSGRDTSDAEEQAVVAAAVEWAVEALAHAHLDAGIADAAARLLAVKKFSANLGYFKQWTEFQGGLHGHLTGRAGEMARLFDEFDLGTQLGAALVDAAVTWNTEGHGAGPDGLSWAEIVPGLADACAYADEPGGMHDLTALHVLRMLALAVNPLLEAKLGDVCSRYVTDAAAIAVATVKAYTRCWCVPSLSLSLPLFFVFVFILGLFFLRARMFNRAVRARVSYFPAPPPPQHHYTRSRLATRPTTPPARRPAPRLPAPKTPPHPTPKHNVEGRRR